MSKVVINLEIDTDLLIEKIGQVGDLNDSQVVFGALTEIESGLQQFAKFEDEIEEVKTLVKQAINARAKQLYGPDWAAIKGNGYKITRNYTGAVYEFVEDPLKVNDEFKKVTIAVDKDAVEAYVKEQRKLPSGVGLNQNRGEQVRITVKIPDEDSQA